MGAAMVSLEGNVVLCDGDERWRDFASSKKGRIAGGEPEEYRHVIYENLESGIVIGSCFSGTERTKMRSHLRDELVTIHRGEAVIELGDGGSMSLDPGDTAFISAGTSYRWIQKGDVVREFLWLLETESGVPTAIKINPVVEKNKCAGPSEDVLLTPNPHCESTTIYRRTDGRLTLMLWSATPYRRRVAQHGSSEFMRILSGDVTLRGGNGEVYKGSPGSGLFVPKGAAVGWESTSDILKIACFIS